MIKLNIDNYNFSKIKTKHCELMPYRNDILKC